MTRFTFFLLSALALFNFDSGALQAKTVATVTLGSLSATYDGTAQPATATTNPPGLNVTFTYDGKPRAPINAGSYTVVGTISDPNFTGTATNTLVISPASASVSLSSASAPFTGRPIFLTATTTPAKLAVAYTYNGSATAPILAGTYTVIATISNPNYTGSANATLTITALPPLAATGVAGVAGTGATLYGTVNPKGGQTTVVYHYGVTTGYGSTTSSLITPAGVATVAAPIVIPNGLTPHTLYHFQIVASNSAGTTNGADKTFTTVAAPVFGNAPTTPVLSVSGAQVGFSVNPSGVKTSVYFEFGTTTGYGSQTPTQAIGAGKASVNVIGFLGPLLANTTYHYRLDTIVNGVINSGPDETFTTSNFQTALVAQTGDAATGLSNIQFTTFGNPILDSSDAVTFTASLSGTGITTKTNQAIFAENNSGTRRLVAQLGVPPPGNFPAFTFFSSPVFNNNADVAFSAQLQIGAGAATSADASSVWTSLAGGALQLVARQGSVAPDTGGATFGSFSSVGLSDSGTVISASLNLDSALGVTNKNSQGVWEGATAGDLSLVLRTGDPAPNSTTLTSFTLFSTQNFVNGQTRAFASSNGDLTALATYSGGVGILKDIAGTVTFPYVSKGSSTAIAGAVYLTFGSPIINNNDHVAFVADLTTGTGGVTAANNLAVLAENGAGTLQVAARTGAVAPGTTADFINFTDPVYNDNEAVAFGGTLKVATGQATRTTNGGIWCNSTGSLALVAQLGTQAPGCPVGATFGSFVRLALPNTGGSSNHGGPIFLASLNNNRAAGVTAANNVGIWTVDNSGQIQLIVRTGDTLNGKVVADISFLFPNANAFLQNRSFSQLDGDLIYLVQFTDNSQAIYNVQFL